MNISPKMPFVKHSIGGVPALDLVINDDSRHLLEKIVAPSEMIAVRVDVGGSRRLRLLPALTKEGSSAIPINLIAQDAADIDYIERLGGAKLTVFGVNGSLRIMPDINAILTPPPKSEHEGKTLDDLLTLAAQKNLPVPRDILRQDLERILDTAKDDPKTATEMAVKARPAQQAKQRRPRVNESQHGGAVYSSSTFNEG